MIISNFEVFSNQWKSMILPIPGVTSFKVTKTDDFEVLAGYTEQDCIKSKYWTFPGRNDFDRSMSSSCDGALYGLEDGPEIDDDLPSWENKHDSITVTNLPENINFKVDGSSIYISYDCSVKKSHYNISGMVYPCVSMSNEGNILLSDITFENEKSQQTNAF